MFKELLKQGVIKMVMDLCKDPSGEDDLKVK